MCSVYEECVLVGLQSVLVSVSRLHRKDTFIECVQFMKNVFSLASGLSLFLCLDCVSLHSLHRKDTFIECVLFMKNVFLVGLRSVLVFVSVSAPVSIALRV